MNRVKYRITLKGCDAETTVESELTQKDVELLKKLVALFDDESGYACMPVMRIEEAVDDE